MNIKYSTFQKKRKTLLGFFVVKFLFSLSPWIIIDVNYLFWEAVKCMCYPVSWLGPKRLTSFCSPVGWGCRICWLQSLQRGKSFPPSILDMTLNYLIVRLHSWSFWECGVLLHCHYSQVHFNPVWVPLVCQKEIFNHFLYLKLFNCVQTNY